MIGLSVGRLSTLCVRNAKILKKTWPTLQDGHNLEEEHRAEKLKDGVENIVREKRRRNSRTGTYAS